MMRAPDPLRLIIIGAVLGIVGLRIGLALRQEQLELPVRPTGTGSIAGAVVDHQGKPVAEARVSLTLQNERWGWGDGRTDAAGRFSFKQLPAGNYLVDAHAKGVNGFYMYRFGASFTSMSTKLAEGQARDGIRIMVVPGGTIEGVVYEEDGKPAGKKYVKAIRIDQDFNDRRYSELPIIPTDAAGHYRVSDIPAGEYVVMAGLDALALRRVYYPKAVRIEDARPISIGFGESRTGIDLRAQPIPTAPITGTVALAGSTPAPLVLDLIRAGTPEPSSRNLETTSGADGHFRFEAVPADSYWIVAHSAMTKSTGTVSETGSTSARLWGMADVTSNGKQPLDIRIGVAPGRTIRGTLVFQALAGQPLPKDEDVYLRLIGRDERSSAVISAAALAAHMDEQHHFSIAGVPPGTFILPPMLTRNWWLESTRIGGATTSGATFTVTRDADLSDVEISLIDQPGTVSGTLRDADGHPLPGRVVVVFAEDAKQWTPFSGRAQAGASDQDGQFSVVGLVAGTYLAGVLDDGPAARWRDSRTLERLRASARRLTLETGEHKSLDLVAKR